LSLPRDARDVVARPKLSTREKQILGMVVLGFSNGEIASKLSLAESTVKSHLSSSFSKLGVRSRNEATAMILDPDGGLGTGILAISEEHERLGPVDDGHRDGQA
jgi:DNA-binding NarL/FixJ family response regulator